jgi:hypothetical protein
MVYREQVYNRTVHLLLFNLRGHLFIAVPSQPCAIRQRFDLLRSNHLFHIASNRPCHPKKREKMSVWRLKHSVSSMSIYNLTSERQHNNCVLLRQVTSVMLLYQVGSDAGI